MAIQNLDLEEQEQLAALKGWWKDNGAFMVAAVVAAAVAAGGWWGWRAYRNNQGLQASALYEALWKGMRTSDAKAVRDAGGALIESYPRTLYASMGALAAARFYADHGDPKNAKAQLQWVVERSSSDELRDIARLRLAAMLLDEKAYDEALKQLEAPHGDPFAAQFAALKGDVLAAKARPAEAKAAYALALEKADKGDQAFRASVQLRLDALGG